MAQGLQVFDGNGQTIFDSNTRTFKVLKQFVYQKKQETFTVKSPLVLEQKVICFITPPRMSGFEWFKYSVSGDTITVTFTELPTVSDPLSFTGFTLTVGVY